MNSIRLRRLIGLVFFLVSTVALADDPESSDRDVVTAERLQQALLKMRLDVEFGGMPKMSPEMLKKMTDRLNPGDFSKLVDRVKDNPAFQKMLKDQGVATPPNLAQDPKTLQAIKDALTRSLPPGATPKTEPSLPTGGNTDIRVPEFPRGDLKPTPKAKSKPAEPRYVDELRPPGSKNRPLTAEEQRRERTAKSLAKAWERMVGPIDDNPALRKALMDMVLAGEDLKGSDGSDLWKFLEENAGAESGQDFGEFLKGLDNLGGDWKLPKLDLSGLDFSGWNWNESGGGSNHANHPSSYDPGSLGDGWFSGSSWTPVILFVVVALVGLLVWRFWSPSSTANNPRLFATSAALGPWPVDPRRLASREDVVKAFEYLTLLRCGEESRAWNHLTIAISLGLLASDSTSAVQVAKLYAQARYAPVADDFSPQDLSEARRHICHLAGVPLA